MTYRAFAVFLICATASPLLAQEVVFKDPKGDDDGPGGYTYPTNAAYKRGSFDLVEFRVRQDGDRLVFAVTVDSDLENPWNMAAGFSVQMVFIHVQTGPFGYSEGLPGTNVEFAKGSAWNRAIILSPQPPPRVRDEVRATAKALEDSILVPDDVVGKGRVILGSVLKATIGEGDPATWGYQVLMQSNEGYPVKGELLTRQVNKRASDHRFGGGADGDCDPHVMDVLAGKGAGEPSEIKKQHEMLKYSCSPSGKTKKRAALKMVRK